MLISEPHKAQKLHKRLRLSVLLFLMFAKARLSPLVVLSVLVPWWQKNQVCAFMVQKAFIRKP